jgi:hypothetical protein
MPGEVRKLFAQKAQTWQPVIRELIKHVNDLVNQRLGWLIQMQGLLFAALTSAWKEPQKELTILFSTLGITTSLSLWSALRLCSQAVEKLKSWWKDHRPDDLADGAGVIGLWSPSSPIGKLPRP